MGGAGAIGAFAYGVPDIGLEPVQRVTGPGNVFVAAAKRLVQGVTGIDAEAGPTDILVIADDSADADFVAADLVSQAEHDELAASVLVTDSAEFADARCASASRRASRRRSTRERVRTAARRARSRPSCSSTTSSRPPTSRTPSAPSTSRSRCATPTPCSRASRTPARSSSGRTRPVSLGDYAAGSNHVLPTGGQARSAAGLSAATFLRPQQVVRYDERRPARGRAGRSPRSRPRRTCPRTARPSRRASSAERRRGSRRRPPSRRAVASPAANAAGRRSAPLGWEHHVLSVLPSPGFPRHRLPHE